MRAKPISDNEPEEEDSESEDRGLSLEELGQTFAQLMKNGDIPYSTTTEGTSEPSIEEEPVHDAVSDEALESDDCPITPKSILEAFLFVGHPQRTSLTAAQIASLMRGVREDEIDQWVVELNDEYKKSHHCMEIVSANGGYQMKLRGELVRVRDRMYGKIKETRLNQPAIDVLSLVAYQPGITRPEIEKQYNQPVGSILSMLIRRNLLELKKDNSADSQARYFVTERMLNLFGLASLDELPQVEDTEI